MQHCAIINIKNGGATFKEVGDPLLLMKTMPIISLKGGTGKSTVTAHLGLSLRGKGFRVGFLDIDISGPNLPSALGIPEPLPHVGLDTEREKMLPIKTNGYEIFSLAFRFGKACLMWRGGEQEIEAFGRRFSLRGTGRYQLVRQMLTNVEFSPDLDYLLLDLPPSSGDETLSLFEHLKDIWGLILVCQPTNLAVEDIQRTLNMIEVKKLPLIGLVGSMMEVICPRCGDVFAPYLDSGVDLEVFCNTRGMPYLESIPLTPDREVIDGKFSSLAQKVIGAKPLKIWQRSFKQKLEEAAIKGMVKGLFGKERD